MRRGIATAAAAALILAAGAASAATSASPSPACARALRAERPVHPRLLTSAPPAALTSILGVLRRPATAADVPPSSWVPTVGYSALWLRYARRVGSDADGIPFFLIPGIPVDTLPPACRASLPASAQRAEAQTDREQSQGAVTLTYHGAAIDEALPLSAAAIERGAGIVVAGAGGSVLVHGVVPDGVASVSVTATGAAPQSAPVSENFFQLATPATAVTSNGASTQTYAIRWLAAGGAVLKRYTLTTVSSASGV